PETALAFAREAKRKAARAAPVREAVALAAYASGDYAEALSELRAVRRMTGDDAHVPLMADCERGLGRPRKALELLASVPEDSLPPEARVEARIVAAGARRDLGLLLLQVPALNSRRTDLAIARLRYAYADTLAELGRTDEAALWFERAMAADPEATTDAADRLAELQGVTFGDDWDDEDVSG
ncbi:MAG: tetratricopeptide repeat protein, partial [bacterium]